MQGRQRLVCSHHGVGREITRSRVAARQIYGFPGFDGCVPIDNHLRVIVAIAPECMGMEISLPPTGSRLGWGGLARHDRDEQNSEQTSRMHGSTNFPILLAGQESLRP